MKLIKRLTEEQQLELDEELAEHEEEENESDDEAEEDDGLDDINMTDEERAAVRDDDSESDDSDDGTGDETDDESSSTSSEEEQSDGEQSQGAESDDAEDGAGESDGQEEQDSVQEATRAAEAQKPLEQQPAGDPEPTADELLAEIETKRATLKEQYEEGELDTTEYLDQRDALSKSENDIEWRQKEAKIHNDLQAAEAQKTWDKAVNEFSVDNGDYLNKVGLQASMQAHLHAMVREAKYVNASASAQLAEAKRRTDADLGITAAPAKEAATEDKGSADKAKRDAMKGRGKQAGKVLPSIGDLPPADSASAESGGKFSHLDELDGMDLERAIAAMSEADQESWLASSH